MLDVSDTAALNTNVKVGTEKRMTKERSNKRDREGIYEMKETEIKTQSGKMIEKEIRLQVEKKLE